MATIDDFRGRLDAEFAMLSAGIEQRRSVIDLEYQQGQQRFVEEFVPSRIPLGGYPPVAVLALIGRPGTIKQFGRSLFGFAAGD
jgi:hypothetical protein